MINKFAKVKKKRRNIAEMIFLQKLFFFLRDKSYVSKITSFLDLESDKFSSDRGSI